MIKRKLLLPMAIACVALLWHRSLAQGSIELVQSVPQESALAQPGLRSTESAWLELINGARESLCIEQFYIADGRRGDEAQQLPGFAAMAPTLDAVLQAAERGVDVRVIVEKIFAEKYPHSVAELGAHEGITCRVIDFGRLGGGIQHAKILVADQQSAYVGSANWDWRALTQIHELGLLIHEEYSCGWIQQVFDLDWQLCRIDNRVEARSLVPVYPDPFPVRTEDALITPVAAPPEYIPSSSLWNGAAILRLLNSAEHSIRIQTLSYGLITHAGEYWDMLDRALRRASQRAVSVELLLSNWTLKEEQLPWLRSLALLPNVSLRISQLKAHSAGEIPFARVEHCKYAVIDGRRAWLGSSNWLGDYFTASRNLGMVIEGGEIPAQLDAIFLRSWSGDWSKDFRGCE